MCESNDEGVIVSLFLLSSYDYSHCMDHTSVCMTVLIYVIVMSPNFNKFIIKTDSCLYYHIQY